MESVLQDIRFACRSLLKKPAFTVVALIALTLGIGANTAIFSVIYSILLRPLPFQAPERLVMVYNTSEKEKADQFSVTYPDFNDWRERNQSFAQLGAYTTSDATLTGAGEPLRLRWAMMTAEVLPILGIQPQKGRLFLADEDKPGSRVVILSDKVWKEQFSADANVTNRSVTLNGESYAIVGVMPPRFTFPLQSDPAVALWTTTATLQEGRPPMSEQRGNHAMDVIGRLKETVSYKQAQADMEAVISNLASQYPDTNAPFGVRIAPVQQELVRDVKSGLWILFGAVGCVLLIACANVANLLLARATTRSKEIAIRTALGASRLRVIRQLLTESLILSCLGGLLGLVLAMWGTDMITGILPKGMPRTEEIGFDATVFGFALLISLATGLLFGIVPALQISKSNLTQTLKEGGRSSSDGAQRNQMRSILVVAEIAIAFMLLVTAGLLINSFFRLQQVKPGFETTNLLSFRLNLSDVRYPQSQQVTQFYKELATRIRSLPGVKSVAYTTALPFSGQGGGVGFSIEGEPNTSGLPFPYDTDYRSVSPGYFRTMGMQVSVGRDFDERDRADSTPVVIINETLAKTYFANQIPLGKRINPAFSTDNRGILMREIIGVVSDVKHASLDQKPQPEVYIAHAQNPRPRMTFAVRTTNDPNTSIAGIRKEVQALDSELPVYNVKTIEQYLSSSVAQPRFHMLLLCIFATVALVLTVVGLYGVMSYAVTQRTHEIGVRMALGARTGDVLRMIVTQGMKLTSVGILLGLSGAFALTRVVESLLFAVTATDPLTFIAVSLILTTVALTACLVPARRAARTDPMVALRYE